MSAIGLTVRFRYWSGSIGDVSAHDLLCDLGTAR